MVQKTNIDTLHKEGKSQRVITERGGCSRSAVSAFKHIKCKVDWKEEIGEEHVHKQQGWPQAWEYCQAKLIQTLGRASQGVNWSWSQCIKSHHAQSSSGKGLTSHFWNRNIVRSILHGLKRKITGLLLSDPKSSFQMKVHFAFHLEIKVPLRVWRKRGEAQNQCCLKSSVKFPQSVMIWDCHVICWCWSTVFSEVHSQSSHLPGNFRALQASADKLYGDADFIFQQDLALAHTAKGTKSWSNDHGVTVLDWPANSPDLNHIENLWHIVDERHQTQQCRWPEGRYQSNLGFITPEQCHRLIVSMPRCIDAVIHAKGGPTKYWVHRNEHIFQKPDISV